MEISGNGAATRGCGTDRLEQEDLRQHAVSASVEIGQENPVEVIRQRKESGPQNPKVSMSGWGSVPCYARARVRLAVAKMGPLPPRLPESACSAYGIGLGHRPTRIEGGCWPWATTKARKPHYDTERT